MLRVSITFEKAYTCSYGLSWKKHTYRIETADFVLIAPSEGAYCASHTPMHRHAIIQAILRNPINKDEPLRDMLKQLGVYEAFLQSKLTI